MKNICLTSLIISCLICTLFAKVNQEKSRYFTFIYSVDIESSNGKKIELWLPVPKSNEVQKISNLKFETDGLKYELKDEIEHGNKYVYIYSNEGTSESKTISMIFDVLRKEHSNVVYKGVENEKYLLPSLMVPTGAVFGDIIKENQLKHNECAVSQARKVYDYVLSGMHYGKPESKDNLYYQEPWLSKEGEYGIKKVSRDEVVLLYKQAKESDGNYTFGNGNSLYACDIGVGNCTDYHSYFMSLSRTLDMPSRFHMGFSIPSDYEGEISGYHCWADYYVKDEGWHPLDISEADKNPKKTDYFFGTVCKNRVEMMVGRDFKLDGYEKELVNLFIYPILEIDNKVSKAFSKSFKYKNI